MRNGSLRVLAVVAFLTGSGFAEDTKPETEVAVDVAVTATRTEVPLKNLPSNVTVIKERDFRGSGARNVGEAIREASGVTYLQSFGVVGALQSLSLRGLGSTRVLVMIDERPVTSPLVGTVDLTTLPLDNVERIEILRGPASALYGAGAAGGVINLVTKKPQPGEPQTEIQVGGGSFAGQVYRLGFGAVVGRSDVYVTGSRQKSDGERANSDYDNTNGSAKLGIVVGSAGRLQLEGGHYGDTIGVPGALRVSASGEVGTFGDLFVDRYDVPAATGAASPKARQERQQEYARAIWSRGWGEGIKTQLKLYGERGFLRFTDPDLAIFGPFDRSLSRNRTGGVEFQADGPSGVTAGADWHRDSAENVNETTGAANFERGFNTVSGYGQIQARLWERLTLIPGFRFDHFGQFGDKGSPRLGAAFQATDRLKLSGNVGRAFRAPTFLDLYFPNTGNPDLRPERSWTWDAGAEYEWPHGILTRGSYYHTSLKDRIVLDPALGPVIGGFSTGMSVNRDESFAEGVELEAEHQVVRWLDYGLSWQLLNQKERNRPGSLAPDPPFVRSPFSPTHRVTGQVRYRHSIGFGAVLTGQYVGRRTGLFGEEMPDYQVFGLRLTQQIAGAQLYLGLDNLLNKRYVSVPGYPLPGFTVQGGLNVRFFG